MLNKSELIKICVLLIAVVGFSYAISLSVLGQKFDTIFYDRATDTHKRDEVVVVGIDDASLQKIGAWPWKRDVFANLIDILYTNGASLIVFDVLFLENREGDSEVLKVLTKYKKPVIFASKFDATIAPLTSVYSNSPEAISGVAHVYPDNDGKVRTVPLLQKDAASKCHPSLAYKAFLLFTKKDFENKCDTKQYHFLYQETLPETLSLINILEGKNLSEVSGKVIFVGSVSVDVEDHFVSRTGEKIGGVYIHANIFTSLLNNAFLNPVKPFIAYILVLVFIAIGIWIAFRIKNPVFQGLLVLLTSLGIIFLITLALASNFKISPASVLFPFLFSSVSIILYRYSQTEKKNTFIKKIFGQYVNQKLLLTLLKENTIHLGGEKKYLTVLFSDIRGFTEMTESMEAKELVTTLNNYFERMSPIVMNEDGVIDKYIGDAIMAFWNAPVEVKHHEEKAVVAALAMVEALNAMNTTNKTNLHIGIGLHAGEAIVGNIGSTHRINYTIIGDTVNACSRIEGLTKKYGVEVLVSEQVREKISNTSIVWRSIDVVRVKGKKEVIKLYQPLYKNQIKEIELENHEKAFSFYIQGDFDKAVEYYKHNNDTHSVVMIDHIMHLKERKNFVWTGVHDWDEK